MDKIKLVKLNLQNPFAFFPDPGCKTILEPNYIECALLYWMVIDQYIDEDVANRIAREQINHESWKGEPPSLKDARRQKMSILMMTDFQAFNIPFEVWTTEAPPWWDERKKVAKCL